MPHDALLRASDARTPREPTPREFREIAALIEDASGVALAETKRALLMRRLGPRLRALGLESFGDYLEIVRADDSGEELVRLLDLVVTNETHFFREPQHFQFLEAQAFPRWEEEARAGRRARTIRCWSAACSTGQEPYSLAMQLLARFPRAQGWTVDVLATDISTRALAVARAGEWPIERAAEIPEAYRRRFMLRGRGERVGRMRATRELREVIRFARLNLHAPPRDLGGPFDLIFCRNALIYFGAEARAGVIHRLTDCLAADGLLFVGHAESLHAFRDRLQPVRATVYARAS